MKVDAIQKRSETAARSVGKFLVGLCWFGIFTLNALAKEDPPAVWRIEIATERENALYALDEKVGFRVSVIDEQGATVDWGSVDYVLSVDGYRELEKHSVAVTGAKGGQVIEGSMDRPGFLRLEVSFEKHDGKVLKAAAAAGIAVDDLSPSRELPVDFGAFWDEQKEHLAEVPLEWVAADVDSGDPQILASDVQVDSIDGVPVSGYVAWPREAQHQSLPAVLWVHGAGVRGSSKPAAVAGAREGFLSMDINAHGLPNGEPAAFYKKLAEEDLEEYWHDGRSNRDGVYFKNMFLRLVRAIDYLTSRPEWDGRVMAVVGHSQGGAQALVAGGLDDRVTFIGAGVPAMCDHTGMLRRRISGWPKFVPILEDGKPDPLVAEVSRYFDAVNFARRCHCEAIVSIGYVDRTCPPTGCYVAYNQLRGKKGLVLRPLMGHAAPPDVKAEFMAALKAHAEARTAPVQAE